MLLYVVLYDTFYSTAILLQNATKFIAKYDSYYKMRQLHYKMR